MMIVVVVGSPNMPISPSSRLSELSTRHAVRIRRRDVHPCLVVVVHDPEVAAVEGRLEAGGVYALCSLSAPGSVVAPCQVQRQEDRDRSTGSPQDPDRSSVYAPHLPVGSRSGTRGTA